MPYELLPHTADAAFKATAPTLEDAFATSAEAMFNIIVKTKEVKPVLSKNIQLKTKSLESLLYEFLDELLFYLDTESFVLHNVTDVTITQGSEVSDSKAQGSESKAKEFEITATAHGDIAENYEVTGNIKSMTYSDMLIKQENDEYVINVVVDI